ncbi:MAG: hypothetical protein R2715_12045 [Ilumatobacteraceae bacterium]
MITNTRLAGHPSGALVDIAVDGDRITAVTPTGTTRPAKVLDAGGAFATAGLTDGHSHWIWGAGMLDWLDLVDLRSLDDILEGTSIPTP